MCCENVRHTNLTINRTKLCVCVEYLLAFQSQITLVRTIMFTHKHVYTILWHAQARKVRFSLRIRGVSRKNYTHIKPQNVSPLSAAILCMSSVNRDSNYGFNMNTNQILTL